MCINNIKFFFLNKFINLTDCFKIKNTPIFKFKINKAINAYKKREINISKGAKIIGVSYREFLDILEERAVPLNMDDFPIDYGLASIEKSLSLTVKNKFKKNK